MTKRPLIPSAAGGLEKFKEEVATDMAIENIENKKQYMGNESSAMVSKITNSGNVGGEMVKRMVASFEKGIATPKK
jgi:small acid-soluble spore protein D (minor alpha/beta-type SASP)